LHTRIPAVEPQRITPALWRALKAKGRAVYVVLHANHPRELTEQAAPPARGSSTPATHAESIRAAACVNDDADTLAQLMRAFVECRIKPYYLHHGDLAPGTSHFRTSIAQGQALMRALRGRTSGLCRRRMCSTSPADLANRRRTELFE